MENGPSLNTLTGRFKIRPFPGNLTAKEWTQLAYLKCLRAGVPEQSCWFSPEVPLRQILNYSREHFVQEYSKKILHGELEEDDETTSSILTSISRLYPNSAIGEIQSSYNSSSSHKTPNEEEEFDTEELHIYLGLLYDVVFFAVNGAKVLMNYIDNGTKQLLISENAICDLAWMLRRLEAIDTSVIVEGKTRESVVPAAAPQFSREAEGMEPISDDEPAGKLTETTPDQYKYDKIVLSTISTLSALNVQVGDRFMSLYESRFRIWAYCQYTVRRFYELTRRLVTLAYVPGDNTKYAIRHDVYKCRSPGCSFLIEVKIDEQTTDKPIMMWYVSRSIPHSCIVSQPTQENLKLFREGQGMHMCRYLPYQLQQDHDKFVRDQNRDLLLRLCWNTLKYSMHIMKRQLRRAQLCVSEHETMFETAQSHISLLVWVAAANTSTDKAPDAWLILPPHPSRTEESHDESDNHPLEYHEHEEEQKHEQKRLPSNKKQKIN